MLKALNLNAAIWGGIIAGLVFLILEMAMVAFIQGMSPWAPPRMMAAIVMGEGVLPPMDAPATFDMSVMMVAMMVHIVITILYGIILGWVISHFELGLSASILAGTLFGLLLYVVNFYGFTAIWPWFAMARDLISIFAHAVYGLVLGWAYHAITASDAPNDQEAAVDRQPVRHR